MIYSCTNYYNPSAIISVFSHNVSNAKRISIMIICQLGIRSDTSAEFYVWSFNRLANRMIIHNISFRIVELGEVMFGIWSAYIPGSSFPFILVFCMLLWRACCRQCGMCWQPLLGKLHVTCFLCGLTPACYLTMGRLRFLRGLFPGNNGAETTPVLCLLAWVN
jgi:hypothetical protein